MENSNILTKGLLSLATIAALSTSAFASNGFYNEKALEAISVNVGYSAIDLDGTSTSGINAGFGMTYYTESVAFGFDYQFFSLADDFGSDSTMYNTDAIIGYRATDALTAYGLVGFSGIGSLSGFAYGGGVKYQLIDYVALDLRYTGSSLSATGIDSFSTTQITAGIEFNFRTTK